MVILRTINRRGGRPSVKGNGGEKDFALWEVACGTGACIRESPQGGNAFNRVLLIQNPIGRFLK